MSFGFSKRYSQILAGAMLLCLPIGIYKSKQVIWAKLGFVGGSVDSRLHEYAPILTVLCIAIILRACFRYFGKKPAIEMSSTGLTLRSYWGFKRFILWENIAAFSIQSDDDAWENYLKIDQNTGGEYVYKLSPVECSISKLQKALAEHIEEFRKHDT